MADRPITAQIEHWVKLGRSVETALRHEDALVLKATGGDLQRAFPGPRGRMSTRCCSAWLPGPIVQHLRTG